MKNIFIIIMLIFSFVASCSKGTSDTSSAENQKDISIAMIVKQSDPWFDDMTIGIDNFKKDSGVNAYVLTPESGDPALQIQIIENLIAQGVSAICIVPNDPASLIPVIKKARDAGIVVVTHEAPNIASHVDLDVEAFKNEEFGVLMGKGVADSLNGTGKYIGFVGALTMTTHMDWFNSAKEYIKTNYPNMQLLSETPYEDGNNMQVAYDKTVEIIKAYPDINAIFDCSANGSGIAQALIDKGRNDIKVVSLAIPSMSATYIKDGSIVHGQAWRPADAGYASAQAAYMLVQKLPVQTGSDLKAEGYTNITVENNIAYGNASLVFTKENIDNYKF